MFEEARLPRSQRSIERYCVPGRLDAFFDTIAKQYWITKTSVVSFIDKLKKDDSFDDSPSNTPPRQPDDIGESSPSVSAPLADSVGQMSATTSDNDGQKSAAQKDDSGEAKDVDIRELKDELENMERKMRNLEMTDQVKDAMLKKTEAQFLTFLEHLTKSNRKVGELESENRRLKSLPPASGEFSRSGNHTEIHEI
jgi:hypothetical protein